MSVEMSDVSTSQDMAETMQVAIVCESTCCLPESLIQQYHIGIIPIPFVFGSETFLDGVDITPAQFYSKLLATKTPPKTSPPSPGEYIYTWRTAAESAPAVVSVTVDSKVSTMQRSALLAQEMAPELLPDVPVVVVDSLSAAMGQGFVALAAARAAARGASLEEVVQIATEVSHRVKMIVTLDTLDFLAKASRIPQVAAFLGGVLAIKPIIQISGGDIVPLARVRTRRRSIDALFERMEQMVPEGERVHVAVQHARAEAEASALEARVRERFNCIEVYTTEFTPVMGGYCGPGLLGLAFYVEQPHVDC